MSDQTPPERIAELEDRIEQLDATVRKMLPGRRDAMKLGGAAVIGAAAMSGTASAGSSQVGTIGDKDASPPQLVDVHAEDIDVSDTITTQDLVVNGTATGPFGGGGITIESGDSITVEAINRSTTEEAFITLYDGTAKDVLGGTVASGERTDFLYTFSDNTTLRKGGSGTSYSRNNQSSAENEGGNRFEVDFLPPAKDVTKIEVGGNGLGGSALGAEVILLD